MMNLHANPMLSGLTAEGVSMINCTQGVTTYGMHALHGVSQYQSPLDQQIDFYEREQLRKCPMLEDHGRNYLPHDDYSYKRHPMHEEYERDYGRY